MTRISQTTETEQKLKIAPKQAESHDAKTNEVLLKISQSEIRTLRVQLM